MRKHGKKSIGVEIQHLPLLPKRKDTEDEFTGRDLNCQIGLTVLAIWGELAIPINWRLFVPESWFKPIPRLKGVSYATIEELAISLIDEVLNWDRTPCPPVVSLQCAGWLGTAFRAYLRTEKIPYLLIVGDEKEPIPIDLNPTNHQLAEKIPGDIKSKKYKTAEEMSCGIERSTLNAMVSFFVPVKDLESELLFVQLIGAWRPVLAFSAGMSAEQASDLISCRYRAQNTLHFMANRFGLADYDARTWRGWHHYVAMSTLAFAFRARAVRRGNGEGWESFQTYVVLPIHLREPLPEEFIKNRKSAEETPEETKDLN